MEIPIALGRQSIKSEDYVNAADFRLLATDLPWDDQALMEQFRYGLHNDVKDLFLTFPKELKSLTDTIS